MDRRRRRNTRRSGKLSEIWVVAGHRGDEQAEAPAILVPDEPDGSWDLSGETEGVLIVCIYGKTNDYYATALPAGIEELPHHRRIQRRYVHALGWPRDLQIGLAARCGGSAPTRTGAHGASASS